MLMFNSTEVRVFGERLREALEEGLRVVAASCGFTADEVREYASVTIAQDEVSECMREVRVRVRIGRGARLTGYAVVPVQAQ